MIRDEVTVGGFEVGQLFWTVADPRGSSDADSGRGIEVRYLRGSHSG